MCGREAVKQLFAIMQSAFPNMRWEPEEILMDGDRAVARVRFNATNCSFDPAKQPSGRAQSVMPAVRNASL